MTEFGDAIEPSPGSSLHSLALRILPAVLILGVEAILASLFLDGATLTRTPGFLVALIRANGAWFVRGAIGFAAIFATFSYLRYKEILLSLAGDLRCTSIRPFWIAAHFVAIALFGVLSAALYGGRPGPWPDLIAISWIAAAAAAVAFVALGTAPWPLWMKLRRATGRLCVFAALASLAACVAGAMSWRLWRPASQLTFYLVKLILRPLVAAMVVQPDLMRIGTRRFTVIIAPECSGLEGIALMLVFIAIWLFLYRQEIRFPQVLLLAPAGVAFLFLLNAARIAALVLIGDAGAREIATRGFHSQAGWIAFNTVAFGFAVIAGRVSWFSAQAPGMTAAAEEAPVVYPAAPYLIPLLAILGAGMISRAVTGGFEWAYSLRLLAALTALWIFRKQYLAVDWKFGWLGPAIGVAVLVLWITIGRTGGGANDPSDRMPPALAAAPAWIRISWIATRVIAAAITVPIAEELAFRGFLLRRFISERFEDVSPRTFTVFSFVLSSFLFGLLHGQRWIAGTAAGALYASASIRRGRLGEAVAAHATTNALLGFWVLAFQKWSFW